MLRATVKRTVWMTTLSVMRVGVSPAKAAINSDPVIAEKLMAAWWPHQKINASQWVASSHYRLKAEGVLQTGLNLQDPTSESTDYSGQSPHWVEVENPNAP